MDYWATQRALAYGPNIPPWDYGARQAWDELHDWGKPKFDFTVERKPEPAGLLPPGTPDENSAWVRHLAVLLAGLFGYFTVAGLLGQGLSLLGLGEVLAVGIGCFWLPILYASIKLRQLHKKFVAWQAARERLTNPPPVRTAVQQSTSSMAHANGPRGHQTVRRAPPVANVSSPRVSGTARPNGPRGHQTMRRIDPVRR